MPDRTSPRKRRINTFCPDETDRELYIWDMIHENIISSYRNELIWVERLRQGLGISYEKWGCTGVLTTAKSRLTYE